MTDVDAQSRGVRRFIGRRWQEVAPGEWAWCPTGEAQEVDYHADLVKACFDGDLWPADEATAKACKVGFDPLFGEEPTQTIREYRAAMAGEQPEEPKTKQGNKAAGKGD